MANLNAIATVTTLRSVQMLDSFLCSLLFFHLLKVITAINISLIVDSRRLRHIFFFMLTVANVICIWPFVFCNRCSGSDDDSVTADFGIFDQHISA